MITYKECKVCLQGEIIMARRSAFRKRRQNRLGMVCVTVVVGMMFIVILISSVGLKGKQEAYIKREEALMEQIAQEEKRVEELEEYEKYTKTAKYVEEVAKEKLGLVYEDEIIFQAEE